MCYFICYVIAISLQVSGALQLLISSLSTKRDRVIQRFAGKGFITRDNNTKEIFYDGDAYRDVYKTAYLTKFSFGFIFVGYLIGIWGEVEPCARIIASVAIALVTVLILIVLNKMINIYVKKSKKTNAKITNVDLERLHIEPDFGNISNEEIDSLFE